MEAALAEAGFTAMCVIAGENEFYYTTLPSGWQ